jgi:type IV fimbrial biogenesis protein FimT
MMHPLSGVVDRVSVILMRRTDVFFDVLNATVLFLGTAIAAVAIARIALKAIKVPAAKRLSSLEQELREQAQRAVIAAAMRCPNPSSQEPAPARGPIPQGTAQQPALDSLQPANQPCWRPARLRAAGFTLPELLTSLSVMAVLAWVSAPHLGALMLDTRVKTAAFDMYSTMIYARSEAIKRNTAVDIIPTGGNWKNGWTVQVGATVLRTVAPAASGLDDIVTPAALTYSGDGRLTSLGTVTYVLAVSGNPNVTVRRVIVDTSGRPSIRQGLS